MIRDTQTPASASGRSSGTTGQPAVQSAVAAGLDRLGPSLFEKSHAAMLILDPADGAILAANPAAQRFYGWGYDELRGMSMLDINVLPADEVRRQMRAARDQDRNFFRFRHRRSDGSLREVEVYASPVHVEGRVLLHSVVHDVTDRVQAERAVRQREEYLRAILRTTADAFWVMDIETGHILEVNDAACRTTGYDRDELLGKPISEIDAQETPADNQARMRRIMKMGSERFETLHRRKDGSVVPMEISATYLEEEGGRIVCFCRDKSERRESEDHIRLLSEMVDAAPAAIMIHDLDGTMLFVNQVAVEQHGYDDAEEILERSLRDIDVPSSAALYDRRLDQLAQNGVARFEASHFRKDGTTFPLEILARTIEWKGRPAVLSVGTDISERKEAEAELHRSRQKYQALFEQSPNEIFVHDMEGRILDVNEKVLARTGYARADLLGMSIFDLHTEPARRDEILRRWKTLAAGDSVTVETRHVCKDGSAYPVEVTINKVRIGSAEQMLAIVRDISESKKLETQLRQTQRMESVGRLAGGVAHDFNNMLSVILGHTELSLAEAGAEHPMRPDLEEIQKAARHSADLTRQLLAFARRQTADPRIVDLNETIESLLKMLKRLIGEDIDLLWDPAETLQSIRIDPTQVDQILANLVVNARDAIGPNVGRVTIETEQVRIGKEYCALHPHFVPGDYVTLTVSDDGEGMDAETRDLIFDPFFTKKGSGEGTGLGLATVYGIVKQNEGFIHVYSEPGEGSAFRIYLPVWNGEPARPDRAAGESAIPVEGGDETVLLVEDEPAILALGEKMLHRLGYDTITAATPSQALERIGEKADAIDLLMTDVVMPEMNGRELAEQLSALNPDLKCLYMSGYTANVIAHHGVLDDNVTFLTKPFTLDKLGRKVREALDHEDLETAS